MVEVLRGFTQEDGKWRSITPARDRPLAFGLSTPAAAATITSAANLFGPTYQVIPPADMLASGVPVTNANVKLFPELPVLDQYVFLTDGTPVDRYLVEVRNLVF